MRHHYFVFSILCVFLPFTSLAQTLENLPQHLQEISVTIKAGNVQGSGVILIRDLKLNSQSEETVKVNFVITAGHVVEPLRTTRSVIDPKSGQSKKVVVFNDASVVRQLVEDGRKVGQISMDAQVIKYSDSDNGHDLALLMIRKKNFGDKSVTFYMVEPEIVPLGTPLYHVGSRLGEIGSNSMTDGIMSQIGRVVTTGAGTSRIFDQTTLPASPGCLTADSVIYTKNEHKKIIDVQMGDTVLSYDNNTVINKLYKPITNGKVLRVWSTGIKQVFKIATKSKTIRATSNHPFVRAVSIPSINNKVYRIAQWCPVEQLQKNDLIAVIQQNIKFKKLTQKNVTKDLLPTGLGWERITDIIPDGEEMTYDMEVDPYHNFFANGFLVHNSSGGGVFLTKEAGDKAGQLVGVIVRGNSDTFNLIVPIRRIKEWMRQADIQWILDSSVEAPDVESLLKIPVEDIGVSFTEKAKKPETVSGLHYLIRNINNSCKKDN